ncbi:hypothetical protein KW797_02805 [Candidatus Parcubacteria bacterium]|nr:hypothetical protein [Candidatus Parcubacteria bacterium]
MEETLLDKIGWIIVVNLILYFKTLRFKFVSDDFSVFNNPPVFKNAWHKRWLQFIGAAKLHGRTFEFVKLQGKHVVVLTKTEEQEHLLALLIHIAICLSIFYAFGANTASFVAALLYSTNPVNNQGTIWPGGRGYALPTLSILLALCVPLASPVLLYFCSWFTVGFLAPLALLGCSKWWILASMPIVWLLHAKKFTTAVKNKQTMETFDEDKVIHPRKIILAIKTFGFYMALCIFPFRITFYHNFLQSAAGSMKYKCYTLCRYFWMGVAGIIGIGLYVALVPWNPISWALCAFTITILPFCNFIRSNQEVAERFAALPNVFLMYALAQVIAPWPALWLMLAVFYATRTYYTLIMYKDEYFITELAVLEDPHSWSAWHIRALKRWSNQSYREAMILWVMARLISPNEFKVLMNLASCLRILGIHAEADAMLAEAQKNIVPGQEQEAFEWIAEHLKGKLPILG